MRARPPAAWTAVALIAVIAGCAAHPSMRAPESGAATSFMTSASHPLLARRCGGCHAIPDPASMPAERWLRALDRMKRRITLPDSEWAAFAAMARADSAASHP